MRPDSVPRRTVLRTCALLGTAATTGLSGCLSTVSPPSDGGFDYENWLVAPTAIEGEQARGFSLVRPADLGAHVDALGSDFVETLVTGETAYDLGVDQAGAEVRLLYGPVTVWHLALDRSAVTGELEDGGYENAGTHEGYDLWTADERAVGVGDHELVVGASTDDVEAVVDAGVGGEERYAAESDDAATLTDQVGGGDVVVGAPRPSVPEETDATAGRFAGHSATGIEYEVDGETTTLTVALVFEREDDVDVAAVETFLDESEPQGFLAGLEDASVAADGRSAVLTGTVDTADLADTGIASRFGEDGGGRPEPPRAGAAVRVDDDADEITVTWSSNQNAEHLTAEFRVDGALDEDATLTEVGDTYTYEGDDGTTVRVLVTGTTEGGNTAVIFDKTTTL